MKRKKTFMDKFLHIDAVKFFIMLKFVGINSVKYAILMYEYVEYSS